MFFGAGNVLVGEPVTCQENDPGAKGQGLGRLAPSRERLKFGTLALAQDQHLKRTTHPLRHSEAPEIMNRTSDSGH